MSDLEVLLEDVEQEMEAVRDGLAEGQVTTMENFRFLRGQFWALKVVQDKIKARIQQREES